MLFGDIDIEMGLVLNIQLIILFLCVKNGNDPYHDWVDKNSPGLLKAVPKKCSLQNASVVQSADKTFCWERETLMSIYLLDCFFFLNDCHLKGQKLPRKVCGISSLVFFCIRRLWIRCNFSWQICEFSGYSFGVNLPIFTALLVITGAMCSSREGWTPGEKIQNANYINYNYS